MHRSQHQGKNAYVIKKTKAANLFDLSVSFWFFVLFFSNKDLSLSDMI